MGVRGRLPSMGMNGSRQRGGNVSGAVERHSRCRVTWMVAAVAVRISRGLRVSRPGHRTLRRVRHGLVTEGGRSVRDAGRMHHGIA